MMNKEKKLLPILVTFANDHANGIRRNENAVVDLACSCAASCASSVRVEVFTPVGELLLRLWLLAT